MLFRIIFALFFIVVSFNGIAVSAAADMVSGSLTVDGKAVALKSIHARFKEDPFEETKQNLVLTMSDVALSAEQMENVFELSDMAKAGKLHLAEVTLDSENKIVGTKILHNAWKEGGIQISGSGTEVSPVTKTSTTAEGNIDRSGDTFDHKWSVKAQFKVAVAPLAQNKAASGSPLAADGGEPGKAYMAYYRAMQTGDFAALKNLLVAARAKDLDRPEIKEMLPMMQSMMAKDVKITSGTSDGTSAWLTLTGKESTGETATGQVEMKLEGGKWKVVKDSWKVKLQ